MSIFILILLVLALHSSSKVVLECPSDSPCPWCATDFGNRTWACMTVPPGNHAPAFDEEIILVEHGFKGLEEIDFLDYIVVFHNNTGSYTCEKYPDCQEDQNKLFGFSRGFVPVMDKSCMYSWRNVKNDPTAVDVFGYGWLNYSYPPWRHPIQNPYMGRLRINTPYHMQVASEPTKCTYKIFDARTGVRFAEAETPMEEKAFGPSYYFGLYFGGTWTATQKVTVSYGKPFEKERN